jgi:hypothetical protein
MRFSRLAAMFAATTAAVATVDAASATAPPPTDPVREAAFEFAQCMRDNGVDDFPDPQVSADGSIHMPAPAGVGHDELAAAGAACEHILPAPDATAPAVDPGSETSEWERITPGGDCECADGSEFSFWARPADPTKVVPDLGPTPSPADRYR